MRGYAHNVGSLFNIGNENTSGKQLWEKTKGKRLWEIDQLVTL